MRRNIFYIIICNILLAAIIIVPGLSAAGVYKYIDGKGKVHYSDHPYAYKQKNYQKSDATSIINEENKKLNRSYLTGVWDLLAYSMHEHADTLPDEGKWLFKSDSSITTQSGDLIVQSQFRFNGKLIEIIESNQWTPYRVLTLNKNDLKLKNEVNGKYLYFKKNTIIKKVSKPIKSYYRRKQVVDLIVFLTCMDVKLEDLSKDDKETAYRDIFEISGIERFDENTFTLSIDKYKNDPIYLEQHQPRINKEVAECRKTNVVPKFYTE